MRDERAARQRDLAHPATLVPYAPPPPPPAHDEESERKEEREVRQQTGEGHRLLSACARELGRDLAVGGGSIRSWIGRGGREVGAAVSVPPRRRVAASSSSSLSPVPSGPLLLSPWCCRGPTGLSLPAASFLGPSASRTMREMERNGQIGDGDRRRRGRRWGQEEKRKERPSAPVWPWVDWAQPPPPPRPSQFLLSLGDNHSLLFFLICLLPSLFHSSHLVYSIEFLIFICADSFMYMPTRCLMKIQAASWLVVRRLLATRVLC